MTGNPPGSRRSSRRSIIRIGRRPKLHADRVVDGGSEVDVGTFGISGSFANPQEVTGY